MLDFIDSRRRSRHRSNLYPILSHQHALPPSKTRCKPRLIKSTNRYKCVPHLCGIQHVEKTELGISTAVRYVNHELSLPCGAKCLLVCGTEMTRRDGLEVLELVSIRGYMIGAAGIIQLSSPS